MWNISTFWNRSLYGFSNDTRATKLVNNRFLQVYTASVLMIFKQYTLNGKRRVSNGKCHVIKRKQTREKVCGLCLNANSCILYKYCICLIVWHVVFVKNRFCHFRTFPWLLKNICKIKTNLSEIRKAPPPPPSATVCFAIFIILESQSEKFWDQNYKLRPQKFKLRPQNYKLRSQNYKLRVQNLQVWQLKLISFNRLTCYSQLFETLFWMHG